MKIIKTLFANILLASVLVVMLMLPISSMGVAKFTNRPVLGTQDVRPEPVPEEQKEYVPLNAKTRKFYIIEKEESIDTTKETSNETDIAPESNPEYLNE